MTRKRPPEQEGTDQAHAAPSPPDGATAPDGTEGGLDDPVEIADLESFPASDPPAWVFEPRKSAGQPQSSRKDERSEGTPSPTSDRAIEQAPNRDANK